MISDLIKEYPSKAHFCKEMGIKNQQYLNQILSGKRPVPPSLCIKLNMVHGIPLHSLRPEIYPQGM